ncbi:ATP synthase subunit gamma, mitochondrial-like [Mytilus edulis]|uniref:ATP synthase subunit gamma, mitochondrial-like n=1 Tax=Mytilus edulis TaxID=6550 RepID=UPI0039F149D4
MFSRTTQFIPQCTQVRGMATLKEIRVRLKSVTNIQKITKSMKMVSAAKYARAERDLKVARPYGLGAKAFYEQAEIKGDNTSPNQLLVAVTSDRGLCGGVHSNVCKAIKAIMNEMENTADTKLVLIGDKSKAMLSRLYAKNVLMSFNDIGKKSPTFGDATRVAQNILDSDYKFDNARMFYNVFKTVVSYKTTEQQIHLKESIMKSEQFSVYDSVDDETVTNYNEFQLASLVYFAMKESATSEQSSRMTAMDGASKNAGEMIEKLTMTFNRTRQAVITRELIEIISGASAL